MMRTSNMKGMLSLRDTIRVNRKYRCSNEELVDYILRLKLNRPPEYNVLAPKGTTQELEQYLSHSFPSYTFGFKQLTEPQPTIYEFTKEFEITDDWIYFRGWEGQTFAIRQPNLFLLVISEGVSLIREVKGKQSFLILECVEVENKVRFVEVKDNYL